jgi:hypothetical protein
VTPEQEEQVRRALQAAAHGDEPATIPPEVAARLDDVLAELTAPRGGELPVTDDDLARRRQRRWPNVLVAAAAVVVIALAGGAVATHGFGTLGSDGDSTSAENAASSQDSAAKNGGNAKDSGVAPSATAPAAKPSGRRQALAGKGAAGLPRLRTPTLAGDVRRVLRQQPALGAPAGPLGCARPATGRGDTLLAVRLDGRRATLLATPLRGGRQGARVYSCDDGGTPVASVSVTAR